MVKKKTIETTKEVIEDVICDSCGNSCKTDFGFENMKLEAHWGYASSKDTEKWSAQICEKCVEEKFKFITFKKENVPFF